MNKETEDQIAAVMLLRGTPKQQKEVLEHFAITPVIKDTAKQIYESSYQMQLVANKLFKYAIELENQIAAIREKELKEKSEQELFEHLHIDDFIDNNYRKDCYARWIFNHFRLPAVLKMDFDQFMKDHKLFCIYQNEQYRCTGASRMGDVWLTKNFNQETGYQLRVKVTDCSNWSPELNK
ncbi:MAG: hypothetical protein ACD_33C00004G0005 [uncultured bacterium]|nr:MAG: hypothetical protein ACD_33C00004G0005 [uncultured bacterium]